MISRGNKRFCTWPVRRRNQLLFSLFLVPYPVFNRVTNNNEHCKKKSTYFASLSSNHVLVSTSFLRKSNYSSFSDSCYLSLSNEKEYLNAYLWSNYAHFWASSFQRSDEVIKFKDRLHANVLSQLRNKPSFNMRMPLFGRQINKWSEWVGA